MTNTSFTLLTEELEDWKETLQFYLNETIRFEDRLATLIRNKPLTEWSQQAESFLDQFTDQIHQLLHLQNRIKQLEEEMRQSKTSLNDSEAWHALRQTMLGSGKAFLELKYNYQNFLSQIVRATSSEITY